jgi:hypothetical protein
MGPVRALRMIRRMWPLVVLPCATPPARAAVQTQQADTCPVQTAPAVATGRMMIIEMRTGDTHLAESPGGPAERSPRWLRMQRVSVSSRYRVVENASGAISANQLEYQVVVRGRLRFDSGDRLSVAFGLFTGSTFTSGWNRSGWGTGDAQADLYVKQLHLAARPVPGMEIQVGGLGVVHGQSTEITGYAYDGFVTGERVSITRPRDLFFDEISITAGHLGKLDRPGVARRLDRLTRLNHVQVLLAKRIGRRATVSSDYSDASGEHMLRQAVGVETPEARVVDVVQFEQYQRAGSDPGYGFATYVETSAARWLTIGVGYASVEHRILNSNRYGQGRRVFLTGHLALGPELSVSGYFTRSTGRDPVAEPRARLDLVVGYNALPRLRRTGLL